MEKRYATSEVHPSRNPKRNPFARTATNVLTGFVLFAAGTQVTLAQCSSMGTGDITGNVSFGPPINWANPNRVEFSDDLYAHTTLDSGEITKYLMVADFGYLIPPTAVIQGIEVRAEVHEDIGADVADYSVLLLKDALPVGLDHAGTGIWTRFDTVNTYGGPTDLWGEAWTPANIMNPGFGVLLSVTRLSGPSGLSAFVDHITVTVYFNDASCVLPVTLTAFKGEPTPEQTVQLSWTTQREMNNRMFTIERSHDGYSFAPIGTVDGQGTTNVAHDYTFTDASPLDGQTYYRLRQLDFNGQATYSDVAIVNMAGAELFSATAYPNPAHDYIRVELNIPQTEMTARIYDLQGKEVLAAAAEPHTAGNLELNISGLKAGMYVLKVSAGQRSDSQKIVVH